MMRRALLPLLLAAAFGASAAEPLLAGTTMQATASAQAMAPLVRRYEIDVNNLLSVYTVENGPGRAAVLKQLRTEWLAALDALPFDSFGVDDRIDWVMLRNQIAFEQREAVDTDKRLADASYLTPFARPLIDMLEARRLMQAQDGQASAALLQKALNELRAAQDKLAGSPDFKAAKPYASRSTANRAVRVVRALANDLKDWQAFYAGYDPTFSWWIKRPYADLDKALNEYADKLAEHLVGKSSTTLLNVTGDPIGRDALISALKREMIPYTPEEMMALAEKELAWGEAELRKAAREMGYGDDWHKAMEKVKTMYVQPGEQPAVVRRLAKEAVDYLEANKLITVPEMAKASWRMDMMSAEAQLINPFFLGGENIIVSYPMDSMTHDQKLMTMRGNNPHFSRATVHHELIPGHHLQYFMSDRYQPQRKLFDTPFYTEGWAVYWEMLLYERGYAVKPEDRIGMMFWRNHRAARILFSLGFHLGKLTPEQAVQMLIDRVGHEPDNARAEVRRSFNGDYPPLYQAGYMIGALQLRALKKELVDGGKMGLKDYHDAVMQSGILPIELLRARLKGDKIPRDFAAGWRFYQ